MNFLNFASSAAALVFYLPSGHSSVKSSEHTLTPRKNRERPESGIFFKIFENTQYLMNTLYIKAVSKVDRLDRLDRLVRLDRLDRS